MHVEEDLKNEEWQQPPISTRNICDIPNLYFFTVKSVFFPRGMDTQVLFFNAFRFP